MNMNITLYQSISQYMFIDKDKDTRDYMVIDYYSGTRPYLCQGCIP